jgi:hypothetical protein
MASQKIADFFAQIGIKVDQKSIDRMGKSFNDIERGLHNMEVATKKSFNVMKPLVKAETQLSKAVQQGNKGLKEQARLLKKNASLEKVRGSAKRLSEGGRVQIGRSRFRGDLSYLDRQKAVTNKARNAQQAMYDNLFGAKQSAYSGLDSSHAAAMREDMRRTRAAQNLARIQENVARREAAMAARTAVIRENGARRAAAIIAAAELKAQSIASRMGGGAGRPSGRGILGGATVGGAVGAASSSIAGFLPGFGGAYLLGSVNKTGQDLVAADNSIRALAPNQKEAEGILGFLKQFGSEIGGSQSDLTKQFASVYASTRSSIGAVATQDMFRGILKYSNVLGMDDEAVKGSLRAVSQMFSKNQIMAEEARSQLMLAA